MSSGKFSDGIRPGLQCSLEMYMLPYIVTPCQSLTLFLKHNGVVVLELKYMLPQKVSEGDKLALFTIIINIVACLSNPDSNPAF